MSRFKSECHRDAVRIADTLRKIDNVYWRKINDFTAIYSNGIYNGVWDVQTDFNDGTRNLRFIQEDEFDQHRTDDMPEWDDIIAEGSGVYIFWAD